MPTMPRWRSGSLRKSESRKVFESSRSDSRIMIVLAWSLVALVVLVASGLITLGIELNRRDYRARDRAAEGSGAVVSFPNETDVEQLQAA